MLRLFRLQMDKALSGDPNLESTCCWFFGKDNKHHCGFARTIMSIEWSWLVKSALGQNLWSNLYIYIYVYIFIYVLTYTHIEPLLLQPSSRPAHTRESRASLCSETYRVTWLALQWRWSATRSTTRSTTMYQESVFFAWCARRLLRQADEASKGNVLRKYRCYRGAKLDT